MADPHLISLRAWPSQDKTADSLPYLIARINEQKGSFRNVTEASLEEEIRAKEAGESNDTAESETKDVGEESQGFEAHGDALATAREEIIKQVGTAYTASSHALDFVSLLLSKHNPKVVEASISPYIKETIPFGSLGAEIMQEPSRSDAEKKTEDLVGLGWRLQSLTRSADSLLASASRLEQEMEHETTYWQQILSVKEKGWSICRIPGDSSTLGVRFGFAEAHAEFRDRGLAALRRNTCGNIDLDRGPRWRGDKQLRVRLLKSGKPTATNEHQMISDDQNQPLTDLLIGARNSLFDEELHHELSRESRNLFNQGVRSVGNAICFPLKDDSEVEVDLQPASEVDDKLVGDSTIPTAIAMTLRILLSHAHGENHHRRSQPPPPISEAPASRRVYPLLRPLLELNQHDTAIKAAHDLLRNLSCMLSAAKLPFTPEDEELSPTSAFTSLLTDLKPPIFSSLPSRLMRPHHTSMVAQLPSTRATLDIHTSTSAPTFGTTFQLRTLADSGPLPQILQFATVDKVAKHLFSITALGTIAYLLREEEALGRREGWRQVSPYLPELVRRNRGRKDRITISVDGEGLSMECVIDKKPKSWQWRGQDDDDEQQQQSGKGLVEVLNESLGVIS
ncbi:MAG: hypothetical protein L6R35_001146 [Caloplaca aegaea]|nr:MAG: hypothetical protein L6R35_001146 [Caloplaca aegaea]